MTVASSSFVTPTVPPTTEAPPEAQQPSDPTADHDHP